jgi:alanine racemase
MSAEQATATGMPAMSSFDARPNRMDIDLDALAANLAQVRRCTRPGVAVIASVKANAYGHGIVPVAGRLAGAGVEVLATGSIADALAMREAGIGTPILMMGGALPAAMPELLRHDLIPTVHNRELADAVAAAADQRTPVYVKVDCGLGRLGVPLRAAHRFVLDLARQPKLEIAGLYTHLSFADAVGRDFARERYAGFDALVAALARDGVAIPITQARASSALLAGMEDPCSAVSPGGFLYGLSPLNPGVADIRPLWPVMASVRTALIQVSENAAEDGGRYAAQVRGATGVVPFGRIDGHRAPIAGAGAHMLIDGAKAPILGVSLEHTVLDLSDVPSPRVGQEVVVMGTSGVCAVTIADIARWQGVGTLDVLMTLNDRVPRRILPTRR